MPVANKPIAFMFSYAGQFQFPVLKSQAILEHAMDSGAYARGLEYQEHVCAVREESKGRLVGKGLFFLIVLIAQRYFNLCSVLIHSVIYFLVLHSPQINYLSDVSCEDMLYKLWSKHMCIKVYQIHQHLSIMFADTISKKKLVTLDWTSSPLGLAECSTFPLHCVLVAASIFIFGAICS